MATLPGRITAVHLGAPHWESYRELRLEMLTVAPTVFWRTLAMVQDKTAAEWQAEISGPRVHWQARINGYPVGTLSLDTQGYDESLPLDDRSANVVAVYIRKEARGSGALELLLQNAAEWMREHDRTQMLLETVDDNTRARRAYERIGFSETGRTFPDPRRSDHHEVEYAVDIGDLQL